MSLPDFNVFATEGILFPVDNINFDIDTIKSVHRPYLLSDRNSQASKALEDMLSRHVDRSINYKKIKRTVVEEGGSSTRWVEPEYDLSEVTTIRDAEIYVKRAYRKRLAHMFKDSFSIGGEIQRNVEYIEKRLAEIAFFTNVTTLELITEIATDFVTKSNAVIVKVRKKRLGSGLPRRTIDGKRLDPVVGYFCVDPGYVEAQLDKFGNPDRYRIYSSDRGRYKEYSADDIIHLTRDKKYSEWTGTPDMVSVAPDIATLRQIEENIELYFYQHLFPLYHYQVGTEDQDATVYYGGEREIDVVRHEIQYMPTEGCIVTPYRHTITPLEQKGRFSSITEIHEIFKNRVFAALGMSNVDFGEGNVNTRATADTLSLQLIDDVKYDLHILENLIQKEVFTELLLEAPFAYNPFKKEELVELVFPDPNKEGRLQLMKVIIEAVDKNLISLDEGRKEIGYRAYDKAAWKNSSWNKFQKAEVELAHPANVSTETTSHTKDDTTKPPTTTTSPTGKKVTKPAPKPKPSVTTVKKNVIKSSIIELFEKMCYDTSQFDDIILQLKYCVDDVFINNLFTQTYILLQECESVDERIQIFVSRKDLLASILDEYIVSEEAGTTSI